MGEPLSGDLGAIVNGLYVPISVPSSYIPSLGETGLAAGKMFLPLEPPYRIGPNGNFPMLEMDQPIDREPPFYDQVDMRVATPCVAPYNWTESTANRTLILDTTPDASASAEEKALPGYVANPGLTLSSKTHADFDPTKYDDDDGIGYLWTYATTGSTPATPHPALRAGQTRYAGISGSAVGTSFDGTPFLPSPLTNGTLKVSAYKHGLLLSDVPSWTVKIKIGRGKATWSKTAQTLTLETTQTTGTTIKYTLNGGSLTTYSGPISITDTATVVWYAEKTNLVTSDSWSTYIEYQDAMPPDDFETIYFSSLPAFSNSPVKAVVQFQRRPDWYISPSGTGTGLTPDSPSNAAAVIGVTGSAGSATDGDLIWASEGDYQASSGASFITDQAIIVRGGYNSSFTERDVAGRKTRFLANNTADEQNALNLSDGVADGLWFDVGVWLETLTYTYGGSTYTSPIQKVYSSGLLFAGGTAWNCRIDVTKEFAAGVAGDDSYFGPVFDSAPPYDFIGPMTVGRCTLFSGTWYGGKIRLRVTQLDGETGLGSSGPSYLYFPMPAGSNKIEFDCGGDPCDTLFDVQINSGDGGQGGVGTDISGDYPYVPFFQTGCFSLGGMGGGTFAKFTVNATRGRGSLSVISGDAGDGGTGGDATNTNAGSPPGNATSTGGSTLDRGAMSDGSFEGTQATLTATGTWLAATEFVAQAGAGGDVGQGGTATANGTATVQEGWGGNSSGAYADLGSGSTYATVASGDGGSGMIGFGASTASCVLSSGVRDVGAATATAGNTGTPTLPTAVLQNLFSPQWSSTNASKAIISYAGAAYMPTLTLSAVCGTAHGEPWWDPAAGDPPPGWPDPATEPENRQMSKIVYPAEPTYFAADALDFTESNATSYGADGQPKRVNAVDPSTAGWYSGTPNGDGAPAALAGGAYYGAQGTGVQLGRYWE